MTDNIKLAISVLTVLISFLSISVISRRKNLRRRVIELKEVKNVSVNEQGHRSIKKIIEQDIISIAAFETRRGSIAIIFEGLSLVTVLISLTLLVFQIYNLSIGIEGPYDVNIFTGIGILLGFALLLIVASQVLLGSAKKTVRFH